MSTCFFVGHHNAPSSLEPLLDAAVEKHIVQHGVTRFIVGHYGAFDAMATSAVIRAKELHPDVELLLLLPYHPSEHPVAYGNSFDGTYYPEGMENVPRRFAIVRANEYVIRHVCDYLIAYDRWIASKTHDFIIIARAREARGGLQIVNLAKLTIPVPYKSTSRRFDPRWKAPTIHAPPLRATMTMFQDGVN